MGSTEKTPVQSGNTEDIILPDLPVIDSHIHLWRRNGTDYLAADFLNDAASGHNVGASIYVECDMSFNEAEREDLRPVGETQHVLRQVEQARGGPHRLAAGIMGFAELMLGDNVRDVLDAHIEAGNGRFKGIRSRVSWDADPAVGYNEHPYYPHGDAMNDPAYVRAAGCLSDLGLVLELWALHPQLDDVCTFAKKVPDLPVVINHLGGPIGIGSYAAHRAEVFQRWSVSMKALAELPNVSVKVGGLGIGRMGFRFPGGKAATSDQLVAAWKPYVETAVDVFGTKRSMFGSNFPVDRAAASYPVLLNAYKKMLLGLNDGEIASVFSGTAKELYKL